MSFLLDELFLNRAGDGKVYFQHLGHQHVNNFILVGLKISLDLGDFGCCLSLQVGLELFVLFLNITSSTLSLRARNYCSFCCLYLLTYCSAAYLAYFNFRCLHQEASTFPYGRWIWSSWQLVLPWVASRCMLSRSCIISNVIYQQEHPRYITNIR